MPKKNLKKLQKNSCNFIEDSIFYFYTFFIYITCIIYKLYK